MRGNDAVSVQSIPEAILRVGLTLALLAGALAGCGGQGAGSGAAGQGGSSVPGDGAGGRSEAGAPAGPGQPDVDGGGGAGASSGSGGASGAGADAGVAEAAAGDAGVGDDSSRGVADEAGADGAAGTTGAADAAGMGETFDAGGRADGPGSDAGETGNCNDPGAPSFKKDVEPFLSKSCGKGNGAGCHVIDGVTTSGSSSGSFDHAYDWITAGAHPSSCPEIPTPKRFEIVIDVINAAHPSTCSKSRQMPPTGSATPLTSCQIAVLRAWLHEPLVTQMHRPDDSSPTTPYPMPPFN